MSKYLKFYKKCMKTGELPSYGLCASFGGLIDLFQPDEDYWRSLWFWGYNGEEYGGSSTRTITHTFTPLRQTIVLFMHEMSKK